MDAENENFQSNSRNFGLCAVMASNTLIKITEKIVSGRFYNLQKQKWKIPIPNLKSKLQIGIPISKPKS